MIREIQFVLFVIVFILSDFLTKIVCTRVWPVLILLLYDWIKFISVTFQGLFKFHQATTVALNLTYQHWNLHVMWGSEALPQSDHWDSNNTLYGCMFWRLYCCGCLLCCLEDTSISLYWTSAEPLTLSGSLGTIFLFELEAGTDQEDMMPHDTRSEGIFPSAAVRHLVVSVSVTGVRQPQTK